MELVSGKKPQILVEKEIPETLESSGEDWTIIAATKGKKQLPEKAGRSRECGIKRAGTKERMLCMDFS